MKINENIIEGSLPKLQIYYKYILHDNTFLFSSKSPSSVQYFLPNKYLSCFSILLLRHALYMMPLLHLKIPINSIFFITVRINANK